MKFQETSQLYSLNKSTYTNLRWIAYIGQLIAILIVQFYFKFQFEYLICILVVFLGVVSNIYLQFRIKENQLKNFYASIYLFFDIAQLGFLIYLTGGITNPFIFLIIIPAIFSAQYLNIWSSVVLSIFTSVILIILAFYYRELPHPETSHFHAPKYYLYSIPLSIFIGLIFLVYFVFKFGAESRIRKKTFEKIQEIMSKENELLSLGGQAAAAAHSLGTPLSTILLTAKELQKEFNNNKRIKKEIDLLISQCIRCRQILKKLTLNPNIKDEFINTKVSLSDCVYEVVRSYQEFSKKIFIINKDEFKNPISNYKSSEIVYGLRNFIGNANKFSNKKIEIFLKSNKQISEVIIRDDGPGFPKDLIDKHRLGEPYIRSIDQSQISKYGLGLGTFIAKTLLEKNFATIIFQNSQEIGGAEVIIKWENKKLINL